MAIDRSDQYHIALTDMLLWQGCPTRRHERPALCNFFNIFAIGFICPKLDDNNEWSKYSGGYR